MDRMQRLAKTLRDTTQAASNAVAGSVSGPVDLIAAALRAGGVPVPENAFGGSQWMAERGLTREVEPGAARVIGETIGMTAPTLIVANAPRIAAGMNQIIANAQAPSIASNALGRQSGIFIGPNAKTWDSQKFLQAQRMAARGDSPEDIWRATGTFKGPDGMWRQEIDDSASRFIEHKAAAEYLAPPGPASYPVGSISNIIEHQNLNEAYPEVMAIKARLDKGASSAYMPNTGFGEAIDVASMNPRSGALHELQHAIQVREGWSPGGSPDDKNIIPHAKMIYAKMIDGFDGTPNELLSMAQDNAYRRLAGEAEARAVQARMDMTPAQRLATFPLKSYDVPEQELIFTRPLKGLLGIGQ